MEKEIVTFEDSLENLFDIENGSTESIVQPPASVIETSKNAVTVVDTSTGEITEYERVEGKTDAVDDAKIDDIYDTAMDAFIKQSQMAQSIDPKFSARSAEVAAQYLNIALNCVQVKTHNKRERFKLKMKNHSNAPATVNGDVTNNNIVVADRNDLLKMLQKQAANNIIDVND